MLKDVARAWGYQESEMDTEAFDPLVSLLIGACALEFEKINQEMYASRERILERLISTLTPGVLTGPVPAHGVIHIRPVQAEGKVLPAYKMYIKKKIDKSEKELYFSVIDPCRLVDGAVRYIAAGNRILRVDNLPFREAVAQSSSRTETLPSNEAWIGLELNNDVQTLAGISFFFNWKNEPKLKTWLQQLPFTRWYLGNNELNFEMGLPSIKDALGNNSQPAPFEQEYSPTYHVSSQVSQVYRPHFITLKGFCGQKTISLPANRENYPLQFEEVFPLTDLAKIEERLLWLKVQFPQFVPTEVLANMECYTNCCPVLNRRPYLKTDRLADFINTIPLNCEEYFFDIDRVYNEKDLNYHHSPLADIRSLEAGHFTLRTKGISKIDTRSTSQILNRVLDVLRDETAAFSMFQSGFLNQKIKTLKQEISDLEQQVKESVVPLEETPYLIIKPNKREKSREATVEFWSTDGDKANGIPSGATLDLFQNKGFQRESLRFVTHTSGGRNRKTDSENFFEFKKALVTRNRVVTHEDIKTFCHAHFGPQLGDISISKKYKVSSRPDEGMVRVIEVAVKQAEVQRVMEEEWIASCRNLEETLNQQSTGILPIFVVGDH